MKLKRLIGIFLTLILAFSAFPAVIIADEILTPEDSADYARLADSAASGTTTEADEFFFTGHYIASYGNTYLEVMMADDFAGTNDQAGIFVKKILADYDNEPYPGDRVYTGVYFNDASQNIVSEMNETVINKLPTAMKGRLMKNEWTIGTQYGILNDAWRPEHAVIRNYVAPPSKDVLDKYAPYLIERINDNEVRGSASDPMAYTAIASQQMSTYRLYVYSTTLNGWTDGAQSRHINGSIFPHFYVDSKAFTEIKLDVATMGDNVKSLFVDKIPRAELAKAGYTEAELATMGYTDDYKITLKSVELSPKMSIGYKFVNNSAKAVDLPAVLAVGYDDAGRAISANVVSVNKPAEANGGILEGTVNLTTEGVPTSVVCCVIKSIGNPVPVTRAAAISHNVKKTTPVAGKIGFEISQKDKRYDFTVAGTLPDNPHQQIFVAVTKPGKKVSDIAKSTDLSEVLLLAEQTVTDGNGGYGFKVSLSADQVKEGEYNACVWYGDNSSQTVKLNHKTLEEEPVKPAEPTQSIKQTVTFDDVNDASWAKGYIEKLATAGYVNGKDGKNFRPNDYITREEFVKILVSALGLKPDATEKIFDDVPSNAWYSGYVNIAYKNGIVNGNGAGGFGTGGNITRQDLATMVCRAAKMSSSAVDVKFADDVEIAEYAKAAVYTLNNAGVLNGKGENKFEPKALATRAEASKIIYLAIIEKKIKNIACNC